MSSVNIDGNKIKALREHQDLTQLYLATVVGVTTDTISRWENKHYPSIKRENAEKLAEALEVTLEELLEQQEPEPAQTTGLAKDKELGSETKNGKAPPSFFNRKVSLTLLSGLALAGALLLLLRPVDTTITCTRIAPAHSAPNTPFPVVVHIEADTDQELPILIREALTGEARAWARGPGGEEKDFGNKPRWIGTLIKGQAQFTYMVTPAQGGEKNGSIAFTGEIMTRKGQKTGSKVEGATSVNIAPYHWADSDKDYRISDSEILIAYETYSFPGQTTFDFSALEELWLAGQYTWNREVASFEIAHLPVSEE